MNVERIVIDASVALKWYLLDEDHTAEADALAIGFFNGKSRLLAPALFDYEVTNTLKVAVVRNRISELDALAAIARFQLLGIERHNFLPLQNDAFKLTLRYQRSAYDAAYLALAQANNTVFYTGDKRLFNAVTNVFNWVKWIGDYPV
ncbi:MAG TPA: type II toxin-antitoxin system VapC family toxin [Blastocatellia bacterium]|nr:type II toxin-antitoxin system VapC family toxin [Blastocatellia bacterium]HMV86394.1 type II toxin-antitoxin system VapC family toxin [Blastocatellia bacterium]HMX26943.1 type II toxin-antitoxin system VapC family toxin [Blastocatellia bacterium]HMY74073.1 type II toxin-antitoxin system VapC family toxin [Blastocatellia bacterium]HMZ20047.1 type II toxin-antitoxin system VapC family toxin [Blastocatellia bacterium]